jgi:hypothetical protein
MPRETFQQELDELVADVIELGTEVATSLESVVEAMMGRDDKVDLLYSEALNLITNPPDDHGGAPEWRMRATQMVHYLERVSDHGVGMGRALCSWLRESAWGTLRNNKRTGTWARGEAERDVRSVSGGGGSWAGLTPYEQSARTNLRAPYPSTRLGKPRHAG